MLEQRNYEVAHYPYKLDTSPAVVRPAIGLQFRMLLGRLPIPEAQKRQVFCTFTSHFIEAEKPFIAERNRREKGDPAANLFYHNLNHTYQAGFDALAIGNSLLQRKDLLTENLTAEGMIALGVAGLFHDIGYISFNPDSDSFASHTKDHVDASIRKATEFVTEIKYGGILDNRKIVEMIRQGIHNTHFPFTPEKTEERKLMVAELPKDWRKEAMIVRLATQLADLGGQTIRKDQYPTGTQALREELEAACPGLGFKIIGSDEDLIKNAQKFTTHMVLPTAGKTAQAFFGKTNTYTNEWEKLLLHQ